MMSAMLFPNFRILQTTILTYYPVKDKKAKADLSFQNKCLSVKAQGLFQDGK